VSLLAGSGKTLLTLAAGLMQTLDYGLHRDHHDRVTVPVGEDIGFLPARRKRR
jgi:PhoH-like ATPase